MSSENPCLACPVEQGCCRSLVGLRVSQTEFDRCFSGVAEQFDIELQGPVLKISVKGAGTCPNWDGQCKIYDSRPMECDLYPHTIGSVFDGKELVLSVHHHTPCPLNEELRNTDEAAIAKVQTFGESIAREGQDVRVLSEHGPQRLQVLGRKLAAKLGF